MRLRVYEMHGTTVVRIPYDYAKDHQIRKTGYVNVREDEHGNLILTPEGHEIGTCRAHARAEPNFTVSF